jgi:hypothetical protein
VEPFHESATPRELPELEELSPTAWQKVAETHDTPLRSDTPEGRVWLVQVEPFHESAMPVRAPVEAS